MTSSETRLSFGAMELSSRLTSLSLYNDRESLGVTPRIPQDLWPNIVSQLPFESVENVIFTCRYFRALAQPLFFRTLAVKHVDVRQRRRSRPVVDGRTAEEEEWILDKLRFYSSSSIARHVEFCRIAPHRHRVPRSSDRQLPIYENDGREIIDKTFNLVHMFSNLTSIYLEWVHLTNENLVQLASASSLEKAVLSSCAFPVDNSPVSLSIKNVLMNDFHPIHDWPLISSFVNPDIVESLCVLRNVAFATLSNPKPYPNLTVLCIDLTCAVQATFPAFLEETPSLRDLILYRTSPTLIARCPPILPDAVPHLEAFEGPIGWAHSFTEGRTIRHLSVWELEPTEHLPSVFRESLVMILDYFLESVKIKVNTLDASLLSSIFERLPNLKALEISCVHMDTKASQLRIYSSTQKPNTEP